MYKPFETETLRFPIVLVETVTFLPRFAFSANFSKKSNYLQRVLHSNVTARPLTEGFLSRFAFFLQTKNRNMFDNLQRVFHSNSTTRPLKEGSSPLFASFTKKSEKVSQFAMRFPQ